MKEDPYQQDTSSLKKILRAGIGTVQGLSQGKSQESSEGEHNSKVDSLAQFVIQEFPDTKLGKKAWTFSVLMQIKKNQQNYSLLKFRVAMDGKHD